MTEANSDLSAARANFSDAKRAFDETVEKKPIPQALEGFFAPLGRALKSALGSTAISWEAAAKAYVASHDALSKLADDAAGPDELRRYTACMKAVTAEYTAVVDRILADNSGAYEKLTDALKGAAGDLKAALQKAKDMAKTLNLMADVVGAFSKLIPVL